MLAPFARHSRPSTLSRAYSGERLYNYFARLSDGVAPMVLLGRGGLVGCCALNAPIRAMADLNGVLHVVAAGGVWRFDGVTATQLGTLIDGETKIAVSVSEIAIVVAGRYYVCDGATTTEYTTGAVTDPVAVAYMDGYFVVAGTVAGRDDGFTVSGLNDGTTFAGDEFAFAEENADPIVDILRNHDVLWIMGTKTVQLYANTGNADFPFEPITGALLEHGVQRNSVAAADNTVLWVRPDGAVVRSGGQEPAIISTPEIKEDIGTITAAFTFSERGHEFYAIQEDGKPTKVFDFVTGAWHQRTSGLDYAPWFPTCVQEAGGVVYLGCSNGQIAIIDAATYTDFGDPMIAEAVSTPIQQGADRFLVRRIHLQFAGGDVAFDNPQVLISISRDGSGFGQWKARDLPSMGNHGKRVTLHALGQFRRAQFKVRITDPVPRDILGVEYA